MLLTASTFYLEIDCCISGKVFDLIYLKVLATSWPLTEDSLNNEHPRKVRNNGVYMNK